MSSSGRNSSGNTRSGRGQNKGNKGFSGSENEKNKNDDEMKFAIYSGNSNGNRVTYRTVRDHICTQIKKTYK